MTSKGNAQAILKKLESGTQLTSQEDKEFEKLKAEYGLDSNGTVKSIKALAETLGVSRPTIYAWKKEGMPVEPDGTYDPGKIAAWRGNKSQAEKTPESEEEVSEKVKWETHFRKFRAKLAETAYRKEIGELIPRGEVETLLVDRAVEFKKALLGRGRRLSLRLAHKDAQECQRILSEDSLMILDTYSRDNTVIKKTRKKRRLKNEK
ncbi:MAG TPA: hypothetical protein VMW09_03500 [Desulfatiglandales bacterium]|nr:hypothetical protein [Desulfatiglandales bacterium]